MAHQPVNPYVSSQWAVGIEVGFIDLGTPTVGSSNTVIPADPMRIWLCVMGYGSIGDWGLWPQQLASVGGIKPNPATGHVLIHNASYTGAVQSQWIVHMGAASGPMVAMYGRTNTIGDR